MKPRSLISRSHVSWPVPAKSGFVPSGTQSTSSLGKSVSLGAAGADANAAAAAKHSAASRAVWRSAAVRGSSMPNHITGPRPGRGCEGLAGGTPTARGRSREGGGQRPARRSGPSGSVVVEPVEDGSHQEPAQEAESGDRPDRGNGSQNDRDHAHDKDQPTTTD